MMFGEFVKEFRISRKITLRDFCRKNEFDPSNWSKVERGILSPPKSKETLKNIARSLDMEEGSDHYYRLFDLALIGHIPNDLVEDPAYLEKLPIFFRTLRGEKPSESELSQIIEIVKGKKIKE